MKKILIIIVTVIATIIMLSVLCGFAPAEVALIDNGGESTQDQASVEIEPTFLERVREWFDANMGEVLGGISTVISTIFLIVVMPYLKNKMTSFNSVTLANSASNNEVVGVVNQLISKYNDLQSKLEHTEDRELSRDGLTKELFIFQKSTLQILTTVYANSKNVPQAVKDLVNMHYVKALKSEAENALINDSIAEAKNEGKILEEV